MFNFVIIALPLIFSAFGSYAFSLDSLIKFANNKSKAITYQINNDGPTTEFIQATVYEITTTPSGEVSEIMYDSSNVHQWKAILSSAKLVLEPGDVKTITLSSLINIEQLSEDLVFSVRFTKVRAPFSEANTGVMVSQGYGVISVFESNANFNPKNEFTIDDNGQQLAIKNNSRRFVEIKVCRNQSSDECRIFGRLLPGRLLSFNKADFSGVDFLKFVPNNESSSYEYYL